MGVVLPDEGIAAVDTTQWARGGESEERQQHGCQGRPDMAEEEVYARFEDGATAKNVFGNVAEDCSLT